MWVNDVLWWTSDLTRAYSCFSPEDRWDRLQHPPRDQDEVIGQKPRLNENEQISFHAPHYQCTDVPNYHESTVMSSWWHHEVKSLKRGTHIMAVFVTIPILPNQGRSECVNIKFSLITGSEKSWGVGGGRQQTATDWKWHFLLLKKHPKPSGEEDDNSYTNEITTRTQFPESWLWLDIRLPAECLPDEPSWWVSRNKSINKP